MLEERSAKIETKRSAAKTNRGAEPEVAASNTGTFDLETWSVFAYLYVCFILFWVENEPWTPRVYRTHVKYLFDIRYVGMHIKCRY